MRETRNIPMLKCISSKANLYASVYYKTDFITEANVWAKGTPDIKPSVTSMGFSGHCFCLWAFHKIIPTSINDVLAY